MFSFFTLRIEQTIEAHQAYFVTEPSKTSKHEGKVTFSSIAITCYLQYAASVLYKT